MGTIMRQNPYQVWEIDAVEGWLDDMASQGYLLESRSGGYFVFRETEPKKVRHRIDVREKKGSSSRDRRDAYRDFGWLYISPLDSQLDIYRAMRADAVELNTDEELLRQALERSQRTKKRVMIFGDLFVLILLVVLIAFSIYRGVFRTLLTGNGLQPWVSLLWFAVISLSTVRSYLAYRAIRRRPLLERSYHSREREAAGRRAARWDAALRYLICGLLLINLVWDGSEVQEDMEIRGSHLEAYSVQQFLPEDAADDAREWSLRYPRALCTEYRFGQYTKNGQRDYDITAYEARWDWLAEGYAKEISRIAGAEEIPVAGHDRAWYYVGTPPHYLRNPYSDYKTDSWQTLILLKGDLVVEISYEGTADLKAAAQN